MTLRVSKAEVDPDLRESMIRQFGAVPEPVAVVWHNPKVAVLNLDIGRKVSEWDAVDENLKSFAHMAVAAQVGCSWCLDIAYFQAQNRNLDVAKASQVPRWRESDVFAPLERDVLEYAEAMTNTPPTVTDDLSARLLDRLGPAGMVELTAFIAFSNLATRNNTGGEIARTCPPRRARDRDSDRVAERRSRGPDRVRRRVERRGQPGRGEWAGHRDLRGREPAQAGATGSGGRARTLSGTSNRNLRATRAHRNWDDADAMLLTQSSGTPDRATLVSGESAERGQAARQVVPRSAHGDWTPAPDRPDPIALLEAQAATRVQELVPIRYGRMLVSPFTFYRGAAAVMAADLAATPDSGIVVQACGDAHISNFGGFAAQDRRLLFGPNDFDETLPGPWEWDVKRMAASVEIAGRDIGLRADRRAGARDRLRP